jgi:hypothetical protein
VLPVASASRERTANELAVARLRIPGPVLYIYPLLIGGGASYVSEYGGFGVVEWEERPLTWQER